MSTFLLPGFLEEFFDVEQQDDQAVDSYIEQQANQ